MEGASDLARDRFETARDDLTRLAGVAQLEFRDQVARDPETVVRVLGDVQLHVPLAGIVDRRAEAARIEKALAKVVKQQAADDAKLANPKFRERAAADVVADTEARVTGLVQQRQTLERLLEELSR